MEPDGQHPAESYLRRWLGSGLTGCSFARRFAKQGGRVAFLSWLDEPSEEMVANLDPFLEQSREEGTFPFVLLPRSRSSSDVVALISVLNASERWEVVRVRWPSEPGTRTDVALGLFWRTPTRLRAAAMGFAPVGSMPVTRRAPYVALALWPGDRDNPYFGDRPGDLVSFADADTKLPKDTHDKLWDSSAEESRSMLRDPFDDVVWLRRVTFCLPRADVERGLPGLLE